MLELEAREEDGREGKGNDPPPAFELIGFFAYSRAA
jgi:hypothetical protein